MRVALFGGFGNQLFQLSYFQFLRAIEPNRLELLVIKPNTEINYFFSKFPFMQANLLEKLKCNLTQRGLNVPGFNNNFELITDESLINHRDFLNIKFNQTLVGYFQNQIIANFLKYEMLKIFESFTVKPSELLQNYLQRLNPSEAVSVHIRRGDYVKYKKFHGLLSLDYYKKILEKIIENNSVNKITIFSDSVDAANELKLKLNTSTDIEIVASNSGLLDMETVYLMSRSKYLVTANSTYSWWAAYLSDEKSEVHYPEKWFFGNKNNPDIFSKTWIPEKNIWE